MYSQPSVLGIKLGTVGAAGGGTGVAALAYTGVNTLHFVVAAVTLIFLGTALLHLIPRREA